jgi:hypothetical protein
VIGFPGLRRDVVILACAISAGIHAALVPVHLEENAAAGGGFVSAAAALALLAVVVARHPGRIGPAAAAVVFGGLIVSYVFATTTGVPVLQPEPEAVDGLALVTKAFELVGIVAAWRLVRRPAAAGVRLARPIPLFLAAIVAVFSAFAGLAATRHHSGHAGHGDHDAHLHHVKSHETVPGA